MPDSAIFKLRAPARQTLGDSVAGSIRAAILEGVFKPGQRLAEAKLASSLKVSRAPVREETLANLEQEGLVHREERTAPRLSPGCRRKMPRNTGRLRFILETATGAAGAGKGVRARLDAQWPPTSRQCKMPTMLTSRAELDLGFHELIGSPCPPQPAAGLLVEACASRSGSS